MKNKQIHFTGIKGVGMTPLAIIAKEAGFTVTGSDVADTFITDEALAKAGIVPFVGFAPEHVNGADILILTGAHGGLNNIEATTAKAQKIPMLLQGQAVGEFMQGTLLNRTFEGISVAGTHGKTTTTALIATVLHEAKMDPSYVIGTSSVPSLGLPGHLGKGKYFVAEADEYAVEPIYDKTTKFLLQHPKIAVFTNIELDHTDIYPSLTALSAVFLQFAKQLPADGLLIACGDNPEVQNVLREYTGKVVTYGFNEGNEYRITRISPSGEQIFFRVEGNKVDLGEFVLKIPGEHNVLNALAALVVGIQVGLQPDVIKQGLKSYTGSKRRAEYVGRLLTGARVYDDYAHHPTEIAKTLSAFRKQYPREKIVAVFQPHTYTRTKVLFDEFMSSFNDADTVILSDIYPSMREAVDPTISSKLLSDAMQRKHRDVQYKPTLSDVVEYLTQNQFSANTIIIIMGAGDIYKVIDDLAFEK